MIKIAFEATDADELCTILRTFVSNISPVDSSRATENTDGDTTEAVVYDTDPTTAAAPVKRGRGRPRKDQTPAPTAVQEAEDEDIHAAAAAAADATTQEQQAPAEPPVSTSVVSDLSPDKARERAIEVMQQHFANNPNAMPEIAKLQAKYGIKKFADIPADKAHALLADVMLIANGNPGE